MAIDIIARGLATSLIGSDGKISSDKMPVIGAVPEGAAFYPVGQLQDPSLIEGKTAEEILFMMLYGLVNPTLTNPVLSIALSDENKVPTIGHTTTLKGALVFDRGIIHPAFSTSGYRSGAPFEYTVGDVQIPSSSTICDFEIELTPTEPLVNLSYSVTYDPGEQPVNSVGQPFDAPYPGGTITAVLQINATYALYNAIGEALEFTWFQDESGHGYVSTFTSEGSGVKQSFAVADTVTVAGIKAFNQMTQQWEWLGGSAAASLTHFDTTILSGESLGETENYVLYTHNQPAKGKRELRIYVLN